MQIKIGIARGRNINTSHRKCMSLASAIPLPYRDCIKTILIAMISGLPMVNGSMGFEEVKLLLNHLNIVTIM